jgi:alpha-tubulin suppressor-like RCC1 family protein
VCWGYNAAGQLGDLTTTKKGTPVSPAGSLSGVVQIEAGDSHTCALFSDGSVQCWGANDYGQIGDTTSGVDRLAPTPVSGLTGATSISAGSSHTCALVAPGDAMCWGRNTYGQLGNGSTVDASAPVPVTGISGADELTAGAAYNCASIAGNVSCWGSNSFGQFGNSTTTNSLGAIPTEFTGVSSISAGASSTCAVMADESARCSGDNVSGQLANGTEEDARFAELPERGCIRGWSDKLVMDLIRALEGAGLVEASRGEYPTLSITKRGDLAAIGKLEIGDLGIQMPTVQKRVRKRR